MIHVRVAKPDDIDAIHSLGEAVAEFSVNDETVTFWPKDILSKAANSEDVLFLVAEADQEIVGFIIANLNFSLRKALIENVYVAPAHRGKGIGDELLSGLLTRLKDTAIEYVATLIPVDANDALHLYTQAGFSKGESFLWLDMSLSDAFQVH